MERTPGTLKLMAMVLRKLEVSAGEGFFLVEVARLFVGVAAGERKCQGLEAEGRDGSEGYGNCSHDNQGIVQMS